jgi:hypothetical protein
MYSSSGESHSPGSTGGLMKVSMPISIIFPSLIIMAKEAVALVPEVLCGHLVRATGLIGVSIVPSGFNSFWIASLMSRWGVEQPCTLGGEILSELGIVPGSGVVLLVFVSSIIGGGAFESLTVTIVLVY